jgi:hypothetical protein
VLCLSFGATACMVNVYVAKELIIFAQRSSRTADLYFHYGVILLHFCFSANDSVYTDHAVAGYSVLKD